MAGLIPFNRRNQNELSTGFGDFDNMLDDFFSDSWPTRRSLMADTFKIDVQENEKAYTVEAEMPGISKGDVGIDYDDGRLRISVKRENQTEEKKKNYIHKERSFSSMSRSVYLDGTNGEGITANLLNGVLTVSVPKQIKPDTSKHIEIN
jgi:HSP20 family protein